LPSIWIEKEYQQKSQQSINRQRCKKEIRMKKQKMKKKEKMEKMGAARFIYKILKEILLIFT